MNPVTEESAAAVPADETSPDRIWRASDADRESVALLIQTAMAQGMLSVIEADERLAAVYAARFRHELEPITADLPIMQQTAVGERSESRLVRVHRALLRLIGLIAPFWVNARALLSRHRMFATVLLLLFVLISAVLLFFGVADVVSE